jgi:hypothetical protein
MGLGWIMDKVRQGAPPDAPLTRPLIWEPTSAHAWESEEQVMRIKLELGSLGFREIGAFRSRQRKHCELSAFFFPLAHFYALLHLPLTSAVPVELCCQLDDVYGISVVNQPGVEAWHVPPDGTVIELPDAPVGLLFTTLLERGAGYDRDTASPEFFLRQFQAAQVRHFEQAKAQPENPQKSA